MKGIHQMVIYQNAHTYNKHLLRQNTRIVGSFWEDFKFRIWLRFKFFQVPKGPDFGHV